MNKNISFKGLYTIECHNKNGELKWKEIFDNLVVDVGLQHLLDVGFSATTNVSPWYIGLADGTPSAVAGDTLASHAGWTEITAYTEVARQEYVEVRSSQTLSNSASKAEFSVNADSTTIGGAFVCSASSGTSGVLMSCAAFTNGDKSCDDGDTISVQYDLAATSS